MVVGGDGKECVGSGQGRLGGGGLDAPAQVEYYLGAHTHTHTFPWDI